MKYILLLLCFTSFLAHCQVKKGNIRLADNVTLTWETKTFDEKEHTLQTCGLGKEAYICTIDDKPWYGSDMGMDKPRNQLTKLILVIDGTYFYPEVTGMFNTNFDGTVNVKHLKLEKYGLQYILHAFFSDGAGTYTVQWRITGKGCVREVISTDEAYFGWQE